MSDVPEEIDAFLRENHAGLRDLALWVREQVLAADPDLGERVYRGWDAIGYRHPEGGYVCAIYPRDDAGEVRLLFEHGARLDDPRGLLHGEGSQTRHLAIREPDSDLPASIAEFVHAAVVERLMR